MAQEVAHLRTEIVLLTNQFLTFRVEKFNEIGAQGKAFRYIERWQVFDPRSKGLTKTI